METSQVDIEYHPKAGSYSQVIKSAPVYDKA